MAIRPNGAVRRGLETLFHLGVIGDLSDGQLLERFTTCGGDAAELAFAALVERHGPMVLRVCRSSLNDPNDAQDAFQATFLVLVQKGALWVQDSLGPWLHRVAQRVAYRAGRSASRRREHERRAAESRPTRISGGEEWNDVLAVLHEEIDRLPERCRIPVVLCDLEGLTHEQVARHLGWPIGTVKSRLTGGRERLRSRLVRRGVAPVAGLLGATSTIRSTLAAVPAELVEATARAAKHLAAGAATAGVVPATVALLVEGALNAMLLTKLKFAVLACGILATGTFVVAQQVRRPPQAKAQPVKAAAITSPAAPSDAVISTTSSISISSAISSPAAASNTPDDEVAIETTLERDMARLDLELLREEVQLREKQVRAALRKKLRAELPDAASGEGEVVRANALKNAQIAYENTRAFYRTKLRELITAVRGLEMDQQKGPADRERPAGTKSLRDARSVDPETTKSAPHPSGAAIGSVDMDAVMKRYDKARRLSEQFVRDRKAESEKIAKLREQFKKLALLMQNLTPGTADYVVLDDKTSAIRDQIEAWNESAQQEFTRRQARMTAALYHEIQESIASVAKTRGLDYVVKASIGPMTDSNLNEVDDALRRSVIYANPRYDLTEEVIRELNRKFKAAEANTSK